MNKYISQKKNWLYQKCVCIKKILFAYFLFINVFIYFIYLIFLFFTNIFFFLLVIFSHKMWIFKVAKSFFSISNFLGGKKY